MGIDGPGMAVIVAHECLTAPQDRFLWVVEIGCYNTLEAQGEDVGAAAAFVMEFVSDALQEIISFVELSAGAFGDDFGVDKLFEFGEAEFYAGDPEDVLVVAQSTAAFFDVWFLEEYGVGVLAVTVAKVLASEIEESFLAFLNTFFVEAFGKL